MTDTTDLIQRLRRDGFYIVSKADCVEAADALEQQAAELEALKRDIESLLPDLTAANVEIEQQAAQIAMLEQRATCGCGDQFTAHDPGTCGNCCAAADRSNEIEALRADAERLMVGHARYETVRLLSVPQFQDAYVLNRRTGKPFDEIIDDLRLNMRPFDAALRQEQPT